MEKYLESNAWPFIEARRILDRVKNIPNKEYVLFETGYGPSGLPHIGTFGEVARTTMVKNAFEKLSDIPTKIICFSDDMDGFRKVPANIPDQEEMRKYLEMPLTSIPDPFGEKESYGDYMNFKLTSFLDKFGFKYEFYSATKCYKSGIFDDALLRVFECYDEIMNILLPTLGEERRSTYSPFLPKCQKTGKILQVPVLERKHDSKTIVYKDENGDYQESKITGGNCKLQWKVDFAMRWYALGVDYEMYGKDIMSNAKIYNKICKVLGKAPPVQFFYELFLNEDGSKISKSKGDYINVDDWIKYGPLESMFLFMYQSPTKAKRIWFDVIPKYTDEYIAFQSKYHETDQDKLSSPLYHIHNGNVPKINMHGLTFGLLLNLVSACNTDDKDVLWKFVSKYTKSPPEKDSFLDKLLDCSINYYNDFVKPNKKYLTPSDTHKEILNDIISILDSVSDNMTASDIQTKIYDVGLKFKYDNLRNYFKDLYQILFGQESGPRLGSFIKLFGIDGSKRLILNKLTKKL